MLQILWCAITIVNLLLSSMFLILCTKFAAPLPVQAVEIVYLRRVSIDNHVGFHPPRHLASSIICLPVQSLDQEFTICKTSKLCSLPLAKKSEIIL